MKPLHSPAGAARVLTHAGGLLPPSVHYRFGVAADARRGLTTGWLLLGVSALVGSGVFSVLLVLSRTPGLKEWFPVADFFRVALVVHVDLSVLVWFVAFAGVFWSLAGSRQWLRAGRAALWLCALGTLGMVAAPFMSEARPVMANYVPVLDGPVFLGSLLVFGAGAGLMVLRALFTTQLAGSRLDGAAALRLGLFGAAVSAAVALFAFLWSWLALPAGLDPRAYYELLFWGGGHVLQFTWTLLLRVAWLWLADAIGARLPLSPRVVLVLFALALLLVFLTPAVYVAYDVTSVEHRRLLTWMMRVGGGVSILPIGLALVLALVELGRVDARRGPLRAALVASVLLFAAGGFIGFAINGANVKIPAHYHGCIVGVTLALMGVAYELLPRLGFRAPRGRLALWQPVVYGVGQLLHVAGLVWSGGYGVQRKIAGADQVLRSVEQVAAMGLMGLGGLIAVVGGILFLVVVGRCMLARPRAEVTA